MGRTPLAALSVFLVGACTFEPVDLEGRSCPCASGWICDEDRMVCVRGGSSELDGGAGELDAATDARRSDGGGDDGGLDGGDRDAAQLDGGGGDAGSEDAGRDDSGPVDSGPVDAGAADSGVLDSTSCDDVHTGTLFCDGFEDALLSAWGWRTEMSGSVVRGTSRTRRGSGALQARTTAGSGKASIASSFSAVGSGDLWFRAWFYVPSGYSMATVSMLALTEGSSPWAGVAVQAVSGDRGHIWIGPEGTAATSTTTIPRDRWFCYRAHIEISSAAGVMEAWIDETLIGRHTGVDTQPASAYSSVITGIEWSSSAQTTAEIWVDDVVVDDSLIECDP